MCVFRPNMSGVDFADFVDHSTGIICRSRVEGASQIILEFPLATSSDLDYIPAEEFSALNMPLSDGNIPNRHPKTTDTSAV